jgi:hypothetical protein
MSFNIRTINKERVLQKFKETGIEGVIDLFNSPDALIMQDEISAYICQEISLNGKDMNDRILEYINKIENL